MNASLSSCRFKLRASCFSEIFPIWKSYLWPHRQSPIQAVSPIDRALKYCPAIKEAKPVFFALVDSFDGIVGTISGYRTEPGYFRCRGLFIREEARRLGLSKTLLRAIERQAVAEGCEFVWSLPRQSAFLAYQSFGFTRNSDWFSAGMEFGPNCLALKQVSLTRELF